ncbi:MAG: aldehyde dehydrogenase family protein [Symbiobacterium sp.]|uniref:aldehyde dehydrogenase family protein n=1 Tax=Symbiobacterium sp. TaxID=1971213 RepID=UPI003464A4EB
MQEIPLWRGGRERTSLDVRVLYDYRGGPLARVALAPSLLVHRVAAELRAAAEPGADLPALWDAIAAAGRLLATAELGGCSPDEHARLVTLATGAPIADSRQALTELASGMLHVRDALRWQTPDGSLEPFLTHRLEPSPGRACGWVPVGRVLGFVAPSNHPAVHLTWVLALAMGWAVAVRPGADDPFTPWRVLLALRAAGFPAERVALLPGGHDLVPALVEHCDRTVAYGGATLAALLGRDPRVLFNGPGRSKVLVDGEAVGGTAGAQRARAVGEKADGEAGETGAGEAVSGAARTTGEAFSGTPGPAPLGNGALPSAARAEAGPGSAASRPEHPVDFLVDCILHDGGRKCTCASAVLLRGEAPGLLEAVAERLRGLPLLDPLDPAARVPAWKDAAAARRTPAEVVESHGLTFVRPALVLDVDPADPRFGLELPAPWATATQVPPGTDPLPLLRGSLAVTLLSRDRALAGRCLREPSIQKLFVGPIPPWHTEPGAPHKGRLADFLFTAKAHREAVIPWS